MHILPKQHSEVNTPPDLRQLLDARRWIKGIGGDIEVIHNALDSVVSRLGHDRHMALRVMNDAYDEVKKLEREIDEQEERITKTAR